MTATSPSKFSTCIAATALMFGLGGIGAAAAQSISDSENGRYALAPVADGVLRLDTRTGAVSTCRTPGTRRAGYALPDDRAAFDAKMGRRQADKEKLKAELAARAPPVPGKIDEPLP